MDAYLRNREGVLVSRDKDSVPYTAQVWFEGRECDTRSENDILKSIRTLAQIHKIMQLPVEMDYAGRNLQEEYVRHNQEMKKIRRFIRKKGAVNSFEKDYLKSVEWFLQKGEEAAAMLETTDYKNLRQQSLQSGSICHGEYNQHNVLMLGKNTAVTNFSHWSLMCRWQICTALCGKSWRNTAGICTSRRRCFLNMIPCGRSQSLSGRT